MLSEEKYELNNGQIIILIKNIPNQGQTFLRIK